MGDGQWAMGDGGAFMWWLVLAKPRQGASPSPRGAYVRKARAELGEGELRGP